MNVARNDKKFALLLFLKEYSPAVLSSSSMWVHSINKDRETYGEYVIIFIGICYHIYWNVSSYLLEYVIIFIGICNYIYWNMLLYLEGKYAECPNPQKAENHACDRQSGLNDSAPRNHILVA